MKAITILQPYASLIAVGAKRFETRSWATAYRGPIAIHAGKKPYFQESAIVCSPFANETNRILGFRWNRLPYGAVIATADLVECWECIGPDVAGNLMIRHKAKPGRQESDWENRYLEDNEILFGDFSKGRYAWELDNVQPLTEPVYCRGRQRLWNWKNDG
jgi:hypothetical protein